MKIICQRDELLSAFQTAAPVAPTRTPKEILKNVKIAADENGAVLTATDMELGIRIQARGVTVEKPGAAVLPVSQFGSLLRESTDEKISIESTDQGVVVRGDRSEFTMPAENPDEFPEVTEFDQEHHHEIAAPVLRELVRRTIFSADIDSARYALHGILLEFGADKMVAVATDGRRLAKMEGPATCNGDHQSGESQTIVPTRSMQLIERSLGDEEGSVQIVARDNDLLVKSSRLTLYTRLVEGRFPKWRDVFPDRPQATRIPLMVGPLYSCVRQAAIVLSKESKGVDFTFEDGSLVLTGSTPEAGNSRVETPITFEKDPISVTLDHSFVSDFLRVLDAEKTIEVEVEDADGAALFTTDDGYGYVVMPLARDRRTKANE
ncbi:MAG: DNA polymerase III subunit beta [bacterium]|nr:DNA polymerase III subunit beta [bacterium]